MLDVFFLSYDEPFADSSQIPTYIIAKFASKKIKVALTGDGGDELFCGYDRYKVSQKIWNLLSLLPKSLRLKLQTFLNKKDIKDVTLFLNMVDKYVPFYSTPQYFGDKILKSIYLLDKGSFEEVYDSLISVCISIASVPFSVISTATDPLISVP